MQVQPILSFNGQCEKALEFYCKAIGAEVTLMMRWKESPDPDMRAATQSIAEKIMHATFRIGDTSLMATDGMDGGGVPDFKGITLAIEAKDDVEALHLFDALSFGGTVRMPLERTFWSSLSGMVDDQFGLSWMVNVAR